MIEISHLNKNYGKTSVLKDVSISLKEGNIIGLLGPNGSGKTTLIKLLNGLLKDYEGKILIDGHEIGVYTKNLISYLPDINYFANWMNGEKAINLFKDMYVDFDEAKLKNLLETLKIDIHQPLSKMSKGMKERFQLALVMSRNAKIYILDEPIGGVDPAARELILNTILTNYNENSIVLISTHIISEIENIFDSVIFLKEGKIELEGNVDQIRNEHNKSIDELFREVFKC